MTAPCNNKPLFFQEETVKVSATTEECCGDIPADALVYYNALYCHVDSANFSAHPTYIDPPCLTQDPLRLGQLLGQTDNNPPDTPDGVGEGQPPADEGDPPVSETPPDTEPPEDEPPVDTPPDTPPVDEDPGDPPDDEPPVVEPPPPPPPPPPVLFRYARGWWNHPTPGKEPMPDQVNAVGFNLATQLFQARLNGYRFAGTPGGKTGLVNVSGDPELNPASPLYDPTAVIGGFCLRNAKNRWSAFIAATPDVRSYVADGTFIGIIIADDWDPGNFKWNGRPPTQAEVDLLAQHIKSHTGWATVNIFVRTSHNLIAEPGPVGGWKYLDGIWFQAQKRDWGPFVNGNPVDRSLILSSIRTQIRSAKDMKLGIMGIGHINTGSGIDWPFPSIIDGDPNRVGWFISPDDINAIADALVTIGDYWMQGAMFWGLSGSKYDYYLRSDIQAAFTSFKNKVKDIKIGPKNYR